MRDESVFYVYAHFDEYGDCRYIGKGKRNRAWNFCQRSKLWNKVFKGIRPKVTILANNLTELNAFEMEYFYVSRALKKGAKLVNVAAGGIGGNTWDNRAKSMLSNMRSGKKHPLYGTKRSEETISKMLETKTLNNSFAKPWLGKKRDPKLIKRLVKAAHTPEANEKRAQLMRGRTLSEEHKQKISKGLQEVEHTPEWGKAISEGKKGKSNGLEGRVMPIEHRQKIAEARRNSPLVKASGQKIWENRRANGTASGFTTAKAKPVECVNTGKVYRCAAEAASILGLSDKHIQACCVGRRKTHGKLQWRYRD